MSVVVVVEGELSVVVVVEGDVSVVVVVEGDVSVVVVVEGEVSVVAVVEGDVPVVVVVEGEVVCTGGTAPAPDRFAGDVDEIVVVVTGAIVLVGEFEATLGEQALD